MTLATDKTKVSSYMDGELVRQIRVLAAMEGHSVSGYLEFLAKREVERARVEGVRFDLLKGASPGGRPIEESFPRPANLPDIKQRISDPHNPSPSFEEERRLIGDNNPTNPYTPPGSITPRGGKQ